MKRRVQLYIEGHKVDLDDDALVLMNYATADLYNPATVRNSFSREIRIPGTPANDDIFGCFFRADRRLGIASEAPALRKGGTRSATISWTSNGDVQQTAPGDLLNLGSFTYNTDRPGESVTIDGTYHLSVKLIASNGNYVTGRDISGGYGYGCVLFVQYIGYDVNGNKVAASPVQAIRWWPAVTGSDLVTFTGYTPDPLNTSIVDVDDSAAVWELDTPGSPFTEFKRDTELAVSMTAVGLKRVDIVLAGYNFNINNSNLSAYTHSDNNGPAFTTRGGTVIVEAKYFLISDATPGGEPEPPDPPVPPTPEPPTPASGNYRTAFDPSARADFVIYADGGNVLMNGYAKLTDVVETGAVHTYALTLYGGLGSFLYNLTQRGDGQRMTLADLDYGGGDSELDFDITAQAVADAWARLGGDTSKPEMWDVINFAPAYNGIPDGEFDPSKAVVVPSDIGFPDTVTIDNVTYGLKGGYALLNYPEAADEWAAKDLRSYLQRPVVSVWRIMQACADPDNNGGWAVDLSDLETDWPYKGMWLTRPLLPSLGTYRQTSGDSVVSFDNTAVGQRVGLFSITGTPAGMETTIRMEFKPMLLFQGQTAARLYTYTTTRTLEFSAGLLTFIQPVAYDGNGNAIAYGNVVTLFHNENVAADTLAGFVHFTPQGGAGFRATRQDGDYDLASAQTFIYIDTRGVSCEVSGVDIATVRIIQTAYMVVWRTADNTLISYTGDGTDPCASLYTDPSTSASAVVADAAATYDGSGTATWVSPSTLRSGAHITKRMLLSTEHTPAEYLVSICKAFGLYIVPDPTRKAVAILRRSSFYDPDTVTDLTHRVDRSHELILLPLTYDARWYDFKHEVVKGAFAKEYAESEGVEYGIQRVDTGYEFDAEAKDLLAGSALRACASVRDRSVSWYIYAGAAGFLPSPLAVPPGGSYTLWDTSGNALDTPINPGAVTADPYSPGKPGYDPAVSRAEFRNAENKPVPGEDVLLFGPTEALLDWHTLENFNLTDDLPAMDSVLGKPCWVAATNPSGVRVPVFTRMKSSVIFGERVVTLSLDFGIPRQVAIPDITYKAGTIYLKAWRDFMHDRLDVDNKVLRCRVHLDGLQVGPDLLRRFWWWRGSLWVLNAITNYSLTTYDTAECEFVQVRDIDNYVSQY